MLNISIPNWNDYIKEDDNDVMLLEEEEDEVQEVEMMKVEDLENAVKQKFSNQVSIKLSCESTLHIFIYILTLYILIFILCLLIFVLLPLDFWQALCQLVKSIPFYFWFLLRCGVPISTSDLFPHSIGPYKVLSLHMKHGPNLKLWGTLSNFKVLKVKLLGQMPQTVSRSDKDDEVEIIEETPEKTSQVDN